MTPTPREPLPIKLLPTKEMAAQSLGKGAPNITSWTVLVEHFDVTKTNVRFLIDFIAQLKHSLPGHATFAIRNTDEICLKLAEDAGCTPYMTTGTSTMFKVKGRSY